MPLLTRMVGTPLAIDIGPGAVAGLAPLLADRRISSGGHVGVAPIGAVDWAEVDDHADLARAREIACRC